MEKEKQNIQVGMVPDYFNSQIKIPDVQREDTAWSLEQKQLLIDSVYNNYDIPKFYFRKDSKNEEIWWLLDGQQRLTAIMNFLDNKFPLDGGDDVTSIPKTIHNKYFKDLAPADKSKIRGRSLDFVIMDCTEDEEEDMFLRLNKGTPLNAAEKRNAIKGAFKDAVKQVSSHKFLKNKVNFPLTRFAGDAVVAQLFLLSLHPEIIDLKGKQLLDIYASKKRFPEKDEIIKKVSSTLTWMDKVFKKKETYLKKYNITSIFLFYNELKNHYSISGISNDDFFKFFNEFESQRQLNNQKDEDDSSFDRDLNSYTIYCVNGSDTKEALIARNKILLKRFFAKYPNLEFKDSNRNFSSDQKEAIYYICNQKCQGVKGYTCPQKGKILQFDECEFDHIKEHTDGGVSSVQNGQILCVDCHKIKTSASKKRRKK